MKSNPLTQGNQKIEYQIASLEGFGSVSNKLSVHFNFLLSCYTTIESSRSLSHLPRTAVAEYQTKQQPALDHDQANDKYLE